MTERENGPVLDHEVARLSNLAIAAKNIPGSKEHGTALNAFVDMIANNPQAIDILKQQQMSAK